MPQAVGQREWPSWLQSLGWSRPRIERPLFTHVTPLPKVTGVQNIYLEGRRDSCIGLSGEGCGFGVEFYLHVYPRRCCQMWWVTSSCLGTSPCKKETSPIACLIKERGRVLCCKQSWHFQDPTSCVYKYSHVSVPFSI